MKRTNIVLAIAAVAASAVFGCSRSSDQATATAEGVRDLAEDARDQLYPGLSEHYAPLRADESVFSSAANPVGWAAESERRAEEEAFARGADTTITPPNAIGGGPTNFDK